VVRAGINAMTIGLCLAVVLPATVASAAAKKESLSYWNVHPCSLLTESQIQGVIRVPVSSGAANPSNTGSGGGCT
jgi:hypothetical protein